MGRYKPFEKEYVSIEELYEAYYDCVKRKRSTKNCIDFEIDLYKNLYKLYIDLNKKEYKIGKSITFCVTKPVMREVFAGDFRDRIIHHLVIRKIENILENEFIDDSYSCRKGKGTSYGVQKCYEYIKKASRNYTRDCYIVKCDLKSFFMTIDKNLLFEKLSHFINEKYKPSENSNVDADYILYLIKLIIYNEPQNNCIRKQKKELWDKLPKDKSLFYVEKDKGLPIGNLTSQMFANFFLSTFDHFMKDELKITYYGRYVDDFFFIIKKKQNIKYLINVIKHKLLEIGVKLHPKKLFVQHWSKGVNFIGATIKPNRIYIGNRTKGNFYWSIQNHLKSLKKNQTPENIKHVIQSINSYLGFLKHYKTYNIRRKILFNKNCINILKYVSYSSNLNKLKLLKKYRENTYYILTHIT